MTRRSIAIFGGSFDPPHVAHVQATEHVLGTESVDEVLVVPVFGHAFGKDMAPFEHRVRMCELAFGKVSRVRVDRIEETLPPPNYTVDTLKALKKRDPDADFRLIVGADVLRDSEKWHAFDEVTRLAPLIPLGRVGVPHEGAPAPELPDVSSTDVRRWLRERDQPEARRLLAAVVPEEVLRYVEAHALYR